MPIRMDLEEIVEPGTGRDLLKGLVLCALFSENCDEWRWELARWWEKKRMTDSPDLRGIRGYIAAGRVYLEIFRDRDGKEGLMAINFGDVPLKYGSRRPSFDIVLADAAQLDYSPIRTDRYRCCALFSVNFKNCFSFPSRMAIVIPVFLKA